MTAADMTAPVVCPVQQDLRIHGISLATAAIPERAPNLLVTADSPLYRPFETLIASMNRRYRQ
jgi:hypothetical protein